jgi:hypothetical protein
MNKNALIILISSLCFFAWFSGAKPFRLAAKPAYKSILKGIPQTNEKGALLWRAIVVGDDKGFSRKEKQTYYQLGLGHLFTPSGVHLATLNPIWRLLPATAFIMFLLGLSMSWINGLGALARVSFAKAIPKALFNFKSFSLVMFLEGVLLSWHTHALSWTCSWLFLGLSWFAPKERRFLWFVLAQMTLCWVLLKPFSLFAPLINILVGLPLLLLFPAALVLSPFPIEVLQSKLVVLFGQVHQFVMWVDEWHLFFPVIKPHAGHLLLFVGWILTRGKRRIQIIPILLILLSDPLNRFQTKSPSQSMWEFAPLKDARVINGVSISRDWRCRQIWQEARWEVRCRPSKRGGKKLKILSLMK